MIYNYIKVALRNMIKERGFTAINILGLSIGIGVCLLLFYWINDELQYDKFHPQAETLYQIQWDGKIGDNQWMSPEVPVPLAEALVREFPSVEQSTQVSMGRITLKQGEEFVRESRVLFSDAQFPDLFKVEVLAGNLDEALKQIKTLAISRSTAEKYFGKNSSPELLIGQAIQTNDGSTYLVKAVFKDYPRQSHLAFDLMTSLQNIERFDERKGDWFSASVLTYFKMADQSDPENLNTNLQAFVDQNVSDKMFEEPGNHNRFPFQSIQDVHIEPIKSYLWIFGIVGIFILLLACVNFINLATAKAVNRAREVGVRKVLGSNRKQLILQFFLESSLYVMFSLVIGVAIAMLVLPQFNILTGKDLSLNLGSSPIFWASMASLLLITTFLTGTFPALTLSAFLPIKTVQGRASNASRQDWFRKGLVIFQFCISAALITATLVVNQQFSFLVQQDLGFQQEQILVIRQSQGLKNNYEPFIGALKNQAGVRQVSIAQSLPGDGFDSSLFFPEQPSNYKETSLSYGFVGSDFIKTLDIQLSEGRAFNPELRTDSIGFLINQTAAKRLGWDDPIGKEIRSFGTRSGQVIGVMEDFNFSSLHEEIQPIVLMLSSWKLSNILVRLEPGNLVSQIEQIESNWKSMAPNVPFQYDFLDEQIQLLYEQESRLSGIFNVFAMLAIFIAGLGLFGLAAFMVEQRSKEIGIRKILGASVAGLFALLSRDFLKLVFVGLVLAVPIAYYFLSSWLDGFAFRINLKWWVFLLSGFIAIGIALLTVSFQSLKAAISNPIESLRND